MRKISLLTACLLSTILLAAQPAGYWQQQVDYTIDVSLNDKEHTLDGFAKIIYTNHSPDTLRFIWFHIWPNAYKNDRTAFSDQLLENGDTRFYFSEKEKKGYINRLAFEANGTVAATEDHPQHIDIIKVLLPAPLAPGDKAVITTPFHVKLPYNFSRGGHIGESYQITQWYPKPAVYDKDGWQPMPYLEQGEFYSEFGNYDVSITLPANYVVAATGILQDEAEAAWLKQRSNFDWKPVKEKKKMKGGNYKIITQHYPASAPTSKTIRFTQKNIHDFAWFADKRFIVAQDTAILPSGKTIQLYSYYTPDEKDRWEKSIAFLKDAVQKRSRWTGDYPYAILSVVQGPASYSGGMEYPTITIVAPSSDERLLDYIISHETGHNWFYGALGSNERKHAWLDEGLNTYYDNRYSDEKYGEAGVLPIAGNNRRVPLKNAERLAFESMAAKNQDQPVATGSEAFNALNYGLSAYYKAGAWLEYIESMIGREAMDKAMQAYYQQWQHKHPQPADLKTTLEKISGRNMDSTFALLDKKGLLPGQERKGSALFFMPSGRSLQRYVNTRKKNIYTLAPAAGINKYDKVMIGAMFTNIKMPASPFRFLAIPMYATGSKSFAGLGRISYSFFPGNKFDRIDIGLNASAHSIDDFTGEDGTSLVQRYFKIVPVIRFTAKAPSSRSTLHRFVQLKSYFLNEDELSFYRDTVINGQDTAIHNRFRNVSAKSTLLQLRLVAENNRVLYPYRAELKIEQGKDFVRTGFTGNYFFNYAKGGGLDLRFFAGKFFYTTPKTFIKEFNTYRYHLNMTGANGYEDYTYSDYFAGRNEFEGMASQQIMMRDGGFKVRTDLLAQKIGRTDDWLAAVNFSTTIPDKINPLSLLPVKIPLKIFADIGTYAEAWDREADTDRFLFDAGLQLSLLKETIHIYLPLIYSHAFKEYIQSTLPKKNRWLKTISFTIDISNFSTRKFSRSPFL